ncbi:MAG TPA: hypothetical protein PLK90_09670 [Clostridiales bacterium]|mgnify:CR=1 FL=1|nr:hypothetical protein [Clostridiales bacterium]HQP70653.1 hypothetical protein [Clostridiales bacterium]
MKKMCLLLIVCIAMASKSYSIDFSNWEPSAYLCFSNGTNAGGYYGAGSEVKLNKFSVNCAIGIDKVGDDDVIRSDFDLGLKFYLNKNFYLGVNYGFLLGYYDSDIALEDYKEVRDFSFTLGFRTNVYHKFYISSFIGTTVNSKANEKRVLAGGTTYTMPRIGIMLGYDLK